MHDKSVEKIFLYLIALSLALHAAVFGLLTLIPPAKIVDGEPTMVDLTDLPNIPPKKRKITRDLERPQRAARETRPKGPVDRVLPEPQTKAVLPSRAELGTKPGLPSSAGRLQPRVDAPSSIPGRPALFPSSRSMARMEDAYREKYKTEVEGDDTKFLDTDDIRFGSFLRHLETAVYGAWRYPLEARQRGIEGVTPVKITFNRAGEIVQAKLLDTSGSRILDDEVLRTLKDLGTIGSFPRGYTGDTWSLIAFFQYRMGRGILR